MFQPLAGPAQLFARAGASTVEAPHSLAAFRLALRLGATGLQADLRVSADGRAVLLESPFVGGRLRRRRVAETAAADLDPQLVGLPALLAEVGPDHELMLDVLDPRGFELVLDLLGDTDLAGRLWLVHSELTELAEWRERLSGVRLVHAVRIAELERGPERHAAELRRVGVDAVSLPFDEWTAGHVALYHRFTRRGIARGAQHERHMDEVLRMGVDGLVSAQVERMVDAAARLG